MNPFIAGPITQTAKSYTANLPSSRNWHGTLPMIPSFTTMMAA